MILVPSSGDSESLRTEMDVTSRKRKAISTQAALEIFDSDDDTSSVSSPHDDASSKKYSRQNHSEIEKRRRDKMNSYITELSGMVPMCNTMSRKLDKLTVLRMAVQHMKTVKGVTPTSKDSNYKPSFLSDIELKHLILEAAEGFLFVVTCDRGKMLYLSESVNQILNINREELFGLSMFDLLHPKDITKVKEQLSSSDLPPRERLMDAKTGLPMSSDSLPNPSSQSSTGARRSFFCRMKADSKYSIKKETLQADQSCSRMKQKWSDGERKNYVTIHCTGYLKSWPSSKIPLHDDPEDTFGEDCILSCLVAIARVQPSQIPQSTGSNSAEIVPTEFVSRHAMDGRFTFVDQRATAILGFLPQELLGTSCYEYYHADDIPPLAESHKAVLAGKDKIMTTVYRFRAKNGKFVKMRTKSFCFRNPWTKEVEYIVCTNTLISCPETADLSSFNVDEDVGKINIKEPISVPGIPCSTRIGAGKIGRMIADEIDNVDLEIRSPIEAEGSSSRCQGTLSSTVSLSCSDSHLRSTEYDGGTTTNTTSKNADLSSLSRQTPNTNLASSSVQGKASNQSGKSTESTSQLAQMLASTRSTVQMTDLLDRFLDKPSIVTQATTSNSPVTISCSDNDDSAMSVIMNLLETDAGLSGPMDVNDLSWSL
ncbi:aryl hydrocarbon receptor nuclear translocator-like [Saccoglossus kowalevskii]|uniref:Aryl hydrocarbon receptor nuclear translocator-like n=1 Tax=Saccoglossus kowalevskii TaxID=10224 RepID=B5THM8_SACKO|nr:aryl hydrocarbon receptor nuclear translocator-like [Saccoglossus kowalevskii]ACH73236.1 aryl hydrocarbon receptor nuclear translocator-like protein [Saccoglossus kowalevskii]